MTNESTAPTAALVEKALNRAYSLGQDYWECADSESYSENKRADVIAQNFKDQRAETLAAMRCLQDEVEALRYLCGCAYQMAGVHDAPKAWLDALSAAAAERPLGEWQPLLDSLLPYTPSAALPASGWRPIESAPKDEFVLVTDGHAQWVAWRMGESWAYANDNVGFDIEVEGELTHWHPLPEPPAAPTPGETK